MGDGDVTASARNGGNGNGHRPTLVDLAFTKGAAVGSGLAAFTLDGVRIRVFGGAQDGVGKCALGGDIQVLKAQNALGDWVGGHVGKSFAYGAQRGLFLIQGNADARAGIRLSGADMVLGGEPTAAAERPPRDARGARQLQGVRVRVHDRRTGRRARRPGPVALQRHDRRRGLRAPEPRLEPRRGRRPPAPVEGGEGQPRPAARSRTTANVVELLDAYREALRSSGQDDDGRRACQALIDDPGEHFIAINPVTQQADPNISTE